MSVVRTFDNGRLKAAIYETRSAMGEAAGELAANTIAALLAQKEKVNVLFASAPSQNEVLAYLKSRKDIAWDRVNAFLLDEYIDLDAEHPAGFGNFLKRAIFDHLPFHSVHLLNGNAPTPEGEAERYTELLKSYPFDLALLGVGENGHLAFNDPPIADFDDPKLVKVVKLEETCRQQQVNDGCFPELGNVPTHALTLTIPALFAPERIICVVPGSTKAAAVKDMLNGQVTTACPASVLTTHSNASLFLDRDSAALI